MTRNHPSIEHVVALFDLEHSSGAIFWKTSSRGHRIGTRAGSEQSDGYSRVYVERTKLPVHRVVWAIVNGRWPEPGKVIDHINGNPRDNRPSNLREVTWQANSQNRQRPASDNRSGSRVPGVCYVTASGRYHINLKIGGRIKFMGSYVRLEDAEASALLLRRQHYAGNTL